MSSRPISRTAAKWLIGIGSFILIVCLSGLFIFSSVYKRILFKELSLVEGSTATKIWIDIPLPIYQKLYFFNITNADAFLRKDEPLNVTEVGPYTYYGKWTKDDHYWNLNNTVSYREVRTYQFVPEESVGTQDDLINTLSGPMILASSILKDYDVEERAFISLMLKLDGEDIIIQRSVRQLVYEGYQDPIIKFAPIVKSDIPFKSGIFSWLYDKNATDDGVFTVFTGENNESIKNIISSWNGEESVNFWNTDDCNKIKGTSIEIGPPLEDNAESYTFFQSIFCRSLTFNYTGDRTHYGVTVKRFEPSSLIFANSTLNPDNACYEVIKERPSGSLDISTCQFNSPILITFPHFYMADPIYLKNINGLNPNSDRHSSHLDVEPITGFSTHVSIKFQLNVEMEQVPGVSQFDSVPEGVFPILWVDLGIEINDNWADFLKGQLNNPKIVGYTIFSILTLLSLISIICGITAMPKYNEDELLVSRNDNRRPSYGHYAYAQDYGGMRNNITVKTHSSVNENQTN